MKQLFSPVIVSTLKGRDIIAWFLPSDYVTMPTLMAHSIVGNKLVEAVEGQLIPGGQYYKSSLVWAGNQSPSEPSGHTLHEMAAAQVELKILASIPCNLHEYPYIVNHTREQYVLKGFRGDIHPLPILTAEGNGYCSGDYRAGINADKVGIWSGDVISIEREAPIGYVQLKVEFIEIGIWNALY